MESVTHRGVIAIALDFDGVIVDSEEKKIQAFAELFQGNPRKALIDAYNRTHRGVPRREKFIHVLEQILETEATTDVVRSLEERYALSLEEALEDSHLVPGIDAFLEDPRVGIPFIAVGTAEFTDGVQRIVDFRNTREVFELIDQLIA